MWDTNPWAKWELSYTTRDGLPVVTETGLWHLLARHPECVERVSEKEYWLYLDLPYHARRTADRAYYRLSPDPDRRRAV